MPDHATASFRTSSDPHYGTVTRHAFAPVHDLAARISLAPGTCDNSSVACDVATALSARTAHNATTVDALLVTG